MGLQETDSFWGAHKGFPKKVAFDGAAGTDIEQISETGEGISRKKEYINRTTEQTSTGAYGVDSWLVCGVPAGHDREVVADKGGGYWGKMEENFECQRPPFFSKSGFYLTINNNISDFPPSS